MTEREHLKPEPNDELLEEIFEHATLRPRPAAEARDRAFATLHAEWRQLTGRRRVRRNNIRWGLAAGVAVAAIIGFGRFQSDELPTKPSVAQVARLTGSDVQSNGMGISSNDSGATLKAGDTLMTGAESRVALTWLAGGSLRLDENTTLAFVSTDTVRMIKGSAYFDSRPFDEMATRPVHISIQTALGTVTHIGTQFLTKVMEDGLTVSVREGEIRFHGADTSLSVYADEELTVSSDGSRTTRPIEPYDETWQWAAEIAPERLLDGRTIDEFLSWVGRETGRRVSYDSRQARHVATTIELVGIGTLEPLRGLSTISYIAPNLRYDVVDEQIVVQLSVAE